MTDEEPPRCVGTRRVVIALALAAAVLACSESEPPAAPENLAECLPVLYPCNDYLHECTRPRVTDEGDLVPVDWRPEEGVMGGERRYFTRRMHCIDSECRPIYVRHRAIPGRSSASYAVCSGGRPELPTCVVDGESCTARWE